MTDLDRIGHITESITKIEEFVKGLNKDAFLRNEVIKYACYANLIILSEAATKLSKIYKEQTSEVEWELIVGFRNFIVHEYFRVNWNIVWDVIEVNLPKLKQKLQQYGF